MDNGKKNKEGVAFTGDAVFDQELYGSNAEYDAVIGADDRQEDDGNDGLVARLVAMLFSLNAVNS